MGDRSEHGAAATILWAVAIYLAVLLVMNCVSAPAIACPAGTYPARVDTRHEAAGSAGAEVSVPTQGGKGSTAWRGAGASVYECRPTCPAPTVPRLQEGKDWRRLDCLPVRELLRPVASTDGGAR